MSLYVYVFVNNKEVASAVATNISSLHEISDYQVSRGEVGVEELNIPSTTDDFTIKNHPRNQSVWALVEKVAGLRTGESDPDQQEFNFDK